MSVGHHPPLGLIEGFFGPPWSEPDRLAFAPFLQKNNFDFYLYAPKADPFLRKKWQEPWPAGYCEKLKLISRHFRSYGLRFGVGFSPFELHSISPREGRQKLQEKLQLLDDAGIDLLGLFFDDMPVHDGLARLQLEALETVRKATKAKIIFCPTFYSPDPKLEKVFGKRPQKYWDEIKTAPPEIEIAWTGPEVISKEISREHLQEATLLLGRKPFLWDNLFANDGPRNCKFLKICAPQGRTAAALHATNGWAWNPMNQAALSQLVLLASKFALLDRTAPQFALEQSLQESCSPELAAFFSRNRNEMLSQGLDRIEPATKNLWCSELHAWNHPMAREIEQWLKGEFSVGAECLTD